MLLDSSDAWWWPFVLITLAGWLPSDLWRVVGTIAAGWIDPDGEWIVLVRAVANALVAAVIANLIFTPGGALAQVPLWFRLTAFGVAVLIYARSGYRLFVGILAGEGFLILGFLLL